MYPDGAVRSFQRGYRVAKPGQIVGSRPGATGSRRAPIRPRRATDDVVIQPASGAAVTVAGLTLGAMDTAGLGSVAHLTHQGRSGIAQPAGRVSSASALTDVTFENLDAGELLHEPLDYFTVRGGDWGPCTVPAPALTRRSTWNPAAHPDRERGFHDYGSCRIRGEHFECMIIFGGQNITIRNNSFTTASSTTSSSSTPPGPDRGSTEPGPGNSARAQHVRRDLGQESTAGSRRRVLPRQVPFRTCS